MSDTNSLRARVASELNRSLADAFGNTNETFAQVVNSAINRAIKHYESQPFRWNQVYRSEWASSTAYVAAVSLPADFIEMRHLEVIYSGRFNEIPRDKLDEINAINYAPSLTSISAAIPSKYTIEGNVVLLAPPTRAARTLVATYTKRYLPTSATDSTTAIIMFAGALTMTVTSTGSHKNRRNGWTTDGADLICARAKAIIKIDFLNDETALQEMAIIAGKGENFLSAAEKQAYDSLADETFDAQATGKIRKYGL